MIDLHLHTTASDGRCPPSELVSRAAARELSVISVVDHDTFAAQPEVARTAIAAGIRCISGIEITAVWHGLDVHILGYYLDPAGQALSQFLVRQREDRVRRVKAMIERLATLGLRIEFEQVTAPVGGWMPQAVGRPQVARALVGAGYVGDVREAFDRYLGEGKPAYVARIGATPVAVVRLVSGAGGIASLAHPGLLGHDELIPDLVAAGMQAIEVYHPDHPPEMTERYRQTALRHGLAPTGGSDYHDEESRADWLGRIAVPPADFERLEALARETHARSDLPPQHDARP